MRVAREQIAAGADWVKMFGSTGSGQDVSGQQTFTYEEMKAAADATHALGKRIAIHSYGPSGARDAVRAGADSVEHATDMDDATIAEMVRRGTFYVPTIDHNRYYAENGDRFGTRPATVSASRTSSAATWRRRAARSRPASGSRWARTRSSRCSARTRGSWAGS